jgi:hypothetical protein
VLVVVSLRAEGERGERSARREVIMRLPVLAQT